ncbi:MAG TPA: class I SAM-dependent methyltransferase [Verrucomicrobiae bacterium]|jgi:2-polyprenyl-3-methyl-5-hydroxy-6-metoxy-1,4-benzoquinol methylase
MVYASPIEEALVTGEFYDQLATPFYLSPDKLESDYSPVRFTREIKLFRHFRKSGRVLDVGCSTGAFLFQLTQQFGTDYQALGIDVAGPALDYAETKGVPVLRESFLTFDSREKKFDAITFWAVLEHLPDPAAFLSRTAALLKAGGLCFILVPNFQSLAVRLLGYKYRYILPQHVNYFTLATLIRLAAREASLRLVHSDSSHFNPLVILQDWRRKGIPVADEERARLLKKTTAYKQKAVLKPVKLALGLAEAALRKLNLADNTVVVLKKTGG